MELIKNIEHGKAFDLQGAVIMEPGRVNSLTLSQTPGCKVTLFAIDEGEGLSTHAASGDALVNVLSGAAEITLQGVAHTVNAGESIVLPAGIPHAVKALTAFKMLLVVVKEAS